MTDKKVEVKKTAIELGLIDLDQYPMKIENVVVQVLQKIDDRCLVRALFCHPFTDGQGASIFRNDLHWFREAWVIASSIKDQTTWNITQMEKKDE